MYKHRLLLAGLSCAVSGLRLVQKASSFSTQEVEGQELMERMMTDDGAKSHGHADHSASVRVAKAMFVPMPGFIAASAGIRKAKPVFSPAAGRSFPMFQPAAGPASSSNRLALNSKASQHTSFEESRGDALNKWIDGTAQMDLLERPILQNLLGSRGGKYVMMLDKDQKDEAPTGFEPTVRVVVSVDWEGNYLHLENSYALQRFHQSHPQVPLTHFLNAAYFTKPEDQLYKQAWSPYQAFSPIDDFGLHLHCWKSLIEYSGVQYRPGPNFSRPPEEVEESEKFRKIATQYVEEQSEVPAWQKQLRALLTPAKEAEVNHRVEFFKLYFENLERRHVGVNVDISAYTVDELREIISTSKAILESQGLPVGQSFRAGAWLAAPNVLEAIRHEGYHVNSSAVGFDQMMRDLPAAGTEKAFWKGRPLPAMLRNLWPRITNESQPFVVDTPAGQILEMPDTGGMADYVTMEAMVDQVDKAVQQLDVEDRFVHLGFHQETAARFVPRIIAAIAEIQQKHGHRVVFETLAASAQHALSSQRLTNEPPIDEDWYMLDDREHQEVS